MAKAGQRIAVTERGKLVAYLVPAQDTGTLLESLAASGDYVPSAGAIDDFLPLPSIPHGRRPLSEVVAELRMRGVGDLSRYLRVRQAGLG